LEEDDMLCVDNYPDISLSIEFINSKDLIEESLRETSDKNNNKNEESTKKRMNLLCVPSTSVKALKKLLFLKSTSSIPSIITSSDTSTSPTISNNNNTLLKLKSIKELDLFYDDKPLNDEFTLLDIASIYAWRRKDPMRLFYTINKANDVEDESAKMIENKTKTVLNPLNDKNDKKSSPTKIKSLNFNNNKMEENKENFEESPSNNAKLIEREDEEELDSIIASSDPSLKDNKQLKSDEIEKQNEDSNVIKRDISSSSINLDVNNTAPQHPHPQLHPPSSSIPRSDSQQTITIGSMVASIHTDLKNQQANNNSNQSIEYKENK
jgi:hypothetical protein